MPPQRADPRVRGHPRVPTKGSRVAGPQREWLWAAPPLRAKVVGRNVQDPRPKTTRMSLRDKPRIGTFGCDAVSQPTEREAGAFQRDCHWAVPPMHEEVVGRNVLDPRPKTTRTSLHRTPQIGTFRCDAVAHATEREAGAIHRDWHWAAPSIRGDVVRRNLTRPRPNTTRRSLRGMPWKRTFGCDAGSHATEWEAAAFQGGQVGGRARKSESRARIGKHSCPTTWCPTQGTMPQN